jgi:hypothetical protein
MSGAFFREGDRVFNTSPQEDETRSQIKPVKKNKKPNPQNFARRSALFFARSP